MSNGSKYILFKGSMQPSEPVVATLSVLKGLGDSGHRQGKDYDIVSYKVLKSKKKKGGYIKKYAKGGGIRKPKD